MIYNKKHLIELYIKNSLLSELNKDNSEFTFYHGGDLEDFKSNLSHKKGRFEYGPGLYLTSSYEVASKYSKGSRKLYLVTVEDGVEIDSVYLNKDLVLNFLKEVTTKDFIKEILNRLARFEKDSKIPVSVVNNLLINLDAVKPSKTAIWRKFLIDNGIDYNIVDNPFGYHDTMLVLYNTNKIKSIKRITSKDSLVDDTIKKPL